MNKERVMQSYTTYIVLAAMLTFALFPLYWMINTSFKSDMEIYRLTPTFWPHKIDLTSGYLKLFETNYFIHMKNSLVVSLSVSVISVFISLLAAYAIAKMKFHGRKIGSRFILYCYLLPGSVMFIPLYQVVSTVGLLDSFLGLIFIYPTFVIPYATWILISYLKTISTEIEESAIVDGCTRTGVLFRIVLPLAMPGVMSTLIFSFMLCWSEFLYSLVMINTDSQKTVSVGLSSLIFGDVYPWATLSAGAVLTTIPIVLIFSLGSRYVQSGLTEGAVKQ